jgi:hypothetical protein
MVAEVIAYDSGAAFGARSTSTDIYGPTAFRGAAWSRRMRRSPFIEVRLASPEVAAGSQTWQASPILVGTMSTSTANSPPFLIASAIALIIAGRSP